MEGKKLKKNTQASPTKLEDANNSMILDSVIMEQGVSSLII